jgi:hypothetical protein
VSPCPRTISRVFLDVLALHTDSCGTLPYDARARRLHDLAESKGINSRGTKDIFG